MEAVWAEADEGERRIFVENLVEWIKVFLDHLEVKVMGSPAINVLMSEVGLKVPENVGVGDGLRFQGFWDSMSQGFWDTSTRRCPWIWPNMP
jgi:hypothetical protein